MSLNSELNYHGCGDTEHNTSLGNSRSQKLPIPRSRSIQLILDGVVEHLHSGRLWRTKFLKSKISTKSLLFSLCQLESLLLKVEGLAWLFFSSARSHFRLSVPHLWGVEAFASPNLQVSSSKLESQQTQERCCGHKTNANIQRTFHKPQESNNSTSQ